MVSVCQVFLLVIYESMIVNWMSLLFGRTKQANLNMFPYNTLFPHFLIFYRQNHSSVKGDQRMIIHSMLSWFTLVCFSPVVLMQFSMLCEATLKCCSVILLLLLWPCRYTLWNVSHFIYFFLIKWPYHVQEHRFYLTWLDIHSDYTIIIHISVAHSSIMVCIVFLTQGGIFSVFSGFADEAGRELSSSVAID